MLQYLLFEDNGISKIDFVACSFKNINQRQICATVQRANEASMYIHTFEGKFAVTQNLELTTFFDIKRSSRNGVIARERHHIMWLERNNLSDVLFSFLPSFLPFNLSRSRSSKSFRLIVSLVSRRSICTSALIKALQLVICVR